MFDSSRPPRALWCLILFLFFSAAGNAHQVAALTPSVFDMPRIHARYVNAQVRIQQLFRGRDFKGAARVCREAISMLPAEPVNYYNLACCQSLVKQPDEALATLRKAISKGFNNVGLLKKDANLQAIRHRKEFQELVALAGLTKPKTNPLLNLQAKPWLVVGRIARVREENTSWDPQIGAFLTKFEFAKRGFNELPPKRDAIATQLYNWWVAGTAAGLENHLYDNHDGEHSQMNAKRYPQLRLLRFNGAAKSRHLHTGLQRHFFYNAITIGNSSTAITGRDYWRSQPRLAYSSPHGISILSLQYKRNHIYVYPEHRDHDSDKKGLGDLFFANTPYVVISQGSSGSDRVFLRAVTSTLAAFHPRAKKKLADAGALMAAVQMVLRRCNKPIETDADYLTGKAHPSAFEGKNVDERAMMMMAHAIRPDQVPPVVALRVVDEDEPVLGVHYFESRPMEKRFTTPSAICRIYRSTQYSRRMTVSAESSVDLNKRPLTWHWKVLRGDSEAITIKPRNPSGSVVEITVPFHGPRPVAPGSELRSNRVDIGCFVHNGAYYSAPAFVTFYSPRGEVRKYNARQQIESVEYIGPQRRYADPALATPREWKDTYRYDDKHRLIGWTRAEGKKTRFFTAEGALVLKKDKIGRAIKALTVLYARKQTSRGKRLVHQQAGELLHYAYESDDDLRGRVVKRQAITRAEAKEIANEDKAKKRKGKKRAKKKRGKKGRKQSSPNSATE